MSLSRRLFRLRPAFGQALAAAALMSVGGCIADQGCEDTATCEQLAVAPSTVTPALMPLTPTAAEMPATVSPPMPSTAEIPATVRLPMPSTAEIPNTSEPTASLPQPEPTVTVVARPEPVACGVGCTEPPHCNDNNECVQCLIDEHCAAAGGDAGLAADASVGGGEAARMCVAGECVECATDVDCDLDASVCSEGECVICLPDRGCATDGGLPFCALTQDRCVECLEDAQCGAGAVCQDNECVSCVVRTGDRTPGNSTPDRGCSAAAPVCVASADAGAAAAPTENAVCAQCETSSDCSAFGLGGWCDNGMCLPCNPADDEGCVEEQRCLADVNGVPQRCVSCLGDGDCPGDARCNAAPAAANAYQCVQCTLDEHCTSLGPSASACISNECMPCVVDAGSALDSDCRHLQGLSVCKDVPNGDNQCVQCTNNGHCSDPTASACADNQCVGCTQDADCANVAADGINLNACDPIARVCVECTVENETACDSNSCDPAENACTDTARGSVSTCGPCLADSECMQGHGCVPLAGNIDDAYCFEEREPGTTCAGAYSVTAETTTRSGVSDNVHCVIRAGAEGSATTCEAVIAFLTGRECDSDGDCPTGASCGAGQLDPNRCTIPCERLDECPVPKFDCEEFEAETVCVTRTVD